MGQDHIAQVSHYCRAWIAGMVLALVPLGAGGETLKVVYPAYEVASDVRFHDLLEILQVALEKTAPVYGPFVLAPSPRGMNEARYLVDLQTGFQSINIAWSSTSTAKETDFLPIRIPLRKGLLGYRVALIAKDKQAQIDQVKTVADLKRFTFGQGLGWGDVALYEANGMTVMAAQYNNLFPMVASGRFDLFPRGIGEILPEFAQHSPDNPNLAIEKNLLIYYPWPYYFFFNKKDAALKQRVEAGIRTMMRDGSFDAIFKKYNHTAILQLGLQKRRVIRIANPLLPKETPLKDASLWFDPSQ